jgi:hypothetical protein
MEPGFFTEGNYIYECKCSPSKMDKYFDTGYLNSAISKLKKLWEFGEHPSGYRYIFPINYIDTKAKEAINNLQKDYPNIDIQYYECDKVEKLILSLKKLNSQSDLITYLEDVIE